MPSGAIWYGFAPCLRSASVTSTACVCSWTVFVFVNVCNSVRPNSRRLLRCRLQSHDVPLTSSGRRRCRPACGRWCDGRLDAAEASLSAALVCVRLQSRQDLPRTNAPPAAGDSPRSRAVVACPSSRITIVPFQTPVGTQARAGRTKDPSSADTGNRRKKTPATRRWRRQALENGD